MGDFLALPPDVRDAFVAVFPAFATHPTRKSHDPDVGQVRNFPGRWRLSVRGYRGVYLILHGRPTFERFDMGHEVYEWHGQARSEEIAGAGSRFSHLAHSERQSLSRKGVGCCLEGWMLSYSQKGFTEILSTGVLQLGQTPSRLSKYSEHCWHLVT